MRQKFATQLLLAATIGMVLYWERRGTPDGLELHLPLGNHAIWLGGAFLVWSTLVLVGTSNAVNLTDGLDGLAGGCTVFAGSAFVALTYLAGHKTMADYLGIPFVSGCGELSVVIGCDGRGDAGISCGSTVIRPRFSWATRARCRSGPCWPWPPWFRGRKSCW